MIALVGIAASLVLVKMTGGQLSRLQDVRLLRGELLIVLFLAQGLARGRLASSLGATETAVTVWGVICVALIFSLWVVRRHTGVSLLITGLVSNLLVVLINDGMPYLVDAGSNAHDAGAFYQAAGASTRLWLLSDVLPLPGGYLLSLGDLLLLVGLVTFVVAHTTKVETPSETS